jgi:hypothetical protein
MNEVSADHASMYHTGISGVRTSVRLPRYYYPYGVASIWFDVYDFMSCVGQLQSRR